VLSKRRRESRGADTDARQGGGAALVVANLRLVVKIALDYYSYHSISSTSYRKERRFLRRCKSMTREGTRFSTYASFWIRAYILKYLMDSWSIVKIARRTAREALLQPEQRKGEARKSGHRPLSPGTCRKPDVSPADIEDMERRLYNGMYRSKTRSMEAAKM